MNNATFSGFWAARWPVLLITGVHAALMASAFVYLFRTFGGAAVLPSMILAVPLLVGVRLCCRRVPWRRIEIAYLAILMAVVFGGNAYWAWRWWSVGINRENDTDLKFAELTRLVRQDPAFRDIAPSDDKQGYGLEGTVATQSDFNRLESLVRRHGFTIFFGDVKVTESTVPSVSKSTRRR